MKKFYQSKTMWANAIALIALGVQIQTGFIISPDMQALLIGLVNIGLRAITNSGLES